MEVEEGKVEDNKAKQTEKDKIASFLPALKSGVGGGKGWTAE